MAWKRGGGRDETGEEGFSQELSERLLTTLLCFVFKYSLCGFLFRNALLRRYE